MRIIARDASLYRDDERPVWGTTVVRKADFLRQIFNVVLAKHQEELDPRTVSDLRKMVWQAENKFKFCSFEIPDPTQNLKKFFESDDILDVLRLLKSHEKVLNDLITEVEKWYGSELADLLRNRIEEIKNVENE